MKSLILSRQSVAAFANSQHHFPTHKLLSSLTSGCEITQAFVFISSHFSFSFSFLHNLFFYYYFAAALQNGLGRLPASSVGLRPQDGALQLRFGSDMFDAVLSWIQQAGMLVAAAVESEFPGSLEANETAARIGEAEQAVRRLRRSSVVTFVCEPTGSRHATAKFTFVSTSFGDTTEYDFELRHACACANAFCAPPPPPAGPPLAECAADWSFYLLHNIPALAVFAILALYQALCTVRDARLSHPTAAAGAGATARRKSSLSSVRLVVAPPSPPKPLQQRLVEMLPFASKSRRCDEQPQQPQAEPSDDFLDIDFGVQDNISVSHPRSHQSHSFQPSVPARRTLPLQWLPVPINFLQRRHGRLECALLMGGFSSVALSSLVELVHVSSSTSVFGSGSLIRSLWAVFCMGLLFYPIALCRECPNRLFGSLLGMAYTGLALSYYLPPILCLHDSGQTLTPQSASLWPTLFCLAALLGLCLADFLAVTFAALRAIIASLLATRASLNGMRINWACVTSKVGKRKKY